MILKHEPYFYRMLIEHPDAREFNINPSYCVGWVNGDACILRPNLTTLLYSVRGRSREEWANTVFCR